MREMVESKHGVKIFNTKGISMPNIYRGEGADLHDKDRMSCG